MRLPVISSHPECEACELHNQIDPDATTAFPESYHPKIPRNVGVGTVRLSSPTSPDTCPAVVFVGRNPGYQEDLKGEPFVGKSGQIVRKTLARASTIAEHAHIYLTNAVRCHTLKDERPPARTFKACLPYLTEDLFHLSTLHPIQPLRLFLFGAEASSFFHKYILQSKKKPSLATLFRSNGTLHDIPDTPLSVYLFYTWHPAYLLREPSHRIATIDHTILLLEHLLGNMPTPSHPDVRPPRAPRTS